MTEMYDLDNVHKYQSDVECKDTSSFGNLACLFDAIRSNVVRANSDFCRLVFLLFHDSIRSKYSHSPPSPCFLCEVLWKEKQKDFYTVCLSISLSLESFRTPNVYETRTDCLEILEILYPEMNTSRSFCTDYYFDMWTSVGTKQQFNSFYSNPVNSTYELNTQRLKGTLLSHQVKNVKFMMKMETVETNSYLWTPIPSTQLPNHHTLFYSKIFNSFAMVDETYTGGFLCDATGMGKSISLIALILQDTEPGTSLIVVPMTLVGQWVRYFKKFAPDLQVLLHYGSKRRGVSIIDYDVVITTPGVVRSDKFNYETSPLEQVYFTRVCIDESHESLCNRNTLTFKAIASLKSAARWCITATPIQYNVLCLRPQMEFLGILSSREMASIKKINDYSITKIYSLIFNIFKSVCCRTQVGIDFELPACHQLFVRLQLPPEIDYESSVRNYIRCGNIPLRRVQALNAIRTLLSNGIVKKSNKMGVEYTDIQENDKSLIESSQCSICLDVLEKPIVVLKCNHQFCEDCILEWSRQKSRCTCPVCRGITKKTEMRIIRDDQEEDQDSSIVFPKFKELRRIAEDPNKKIAVFSQYTQTLRELNRYLKDVPHSILKGSMHKRRSELEKFQRGDHKIILLSMKSNGSGLDLNTATDIVFMETTLNTSSMIQAVGRAIRIGNVNPSVHVHHLFFGNTAEERIMTLWNNRHTSQSEVLIKSLETKTFAETINKSHLLENSMFTKKITDLIVL